MECTVIVLQERYYRYIYNIFIYICHALLHWIHISLITATDQYINHVNLAATKMYVYMMMYVLR